MKNIYKYLMLSIFAVLGLSLTSCKNDEETLSRKVLVSVKVLDYKAIGGDAEIITVTSDGDWYVEAPEWITVSPAQGSVGQTDVMVTVDDNMRDGAMDNPRRADVLFKGRNLESIATVLIKQDGDKFRDPLDYSFEDLNNAADETVVRLPNVVVTYITDKGFLASYENETIYIMNVEETENPDIKEKTVNPDIKVGSVLNIVGEKFTDKMHMVYVNGDKLEVVGEGTVPEIEPFDATAALDALAGTKYQLIKITGIFNGANIDVENAVNKVYLIDAPETLRIEELTGHKISVTGYFAGVASPALNIIPVAVEDFGINMVSIFTEDFEWISPWAIAGKNSDGSIPAGNTIGTNGKETEAPKADACKHDGMTLTEALMRRGYDFVSAHDYNDAKGARDFALYVQQNYLKFNKTGNVNGKPYQEGIILPELENVPEGKELKISFDWCPQQQGDGMYDKTQMAVIVVNDGGETEIVCPDHTRPNGSAYSWQRADVAFGNVPVKNGTKIIIRNSNKAFADKTAHRFYLDNINIYYLP